MSKCWSLKIYIPKPVLPEAVFGDLSIHVSDYPPRRPVSCRSGSTTAKEASFWVLTNLRGPSTRERKPVFVKRDLSLHGVGWSLSHTAYGRTVSRVVKSQEGPTALGGGYRGIYLPDERLVVEQVCGKITLVQCTNGYDERSVKLPVVASRRHAQIPQSR